MLAAEALVPVRAGVTAGLDVARFGAVPHRHGGLPDLLAQPFAREQLLNDRRSLVAVTVDLERCEPFDGFAFADVADGVVALGRVHVRVPHQLGEHVDRGAVVGVTLRVAVPERVGDHPLARGRVTVAVEQHLERRDPPADHTANAVFGPRARHSFGSASAAATTIDAPRGSPRTLAPILFMT